MKACRRTLGAFWRAGHRQLRVCVRCCIWHGSQASSSQLCRHPQRSSGLLQLLLRTMKLTAVSLLKWNGEKDAYLLGIATDLSSFGYFQRSTVKEMLTFLSRTVAKRTQPGQRQSVQQEEYYAHIYNRDGLVGIAIVDKEYSARAAFGVVNKILDDFSESSQQKWRSISSDSTDAQPVLDSAIVKFQVRLAQSPCLVVS